MSSPAFHADGGAACEDDAGGLSEPLLVNGAGDVGFHDGALAAVVVATSVHAGGSSGKEKGVVKAKDDGYWVDVPEEQAVADLESGGAGDRPLLFSTKKVKAALLYPYR